MVQDVHDLYLGFGFGHVGFGLIGFLFGLQLPYIFPCRPRYRAARIDGTAFILTLGLLCCLR